MRTLPQDLRYALRALWRAPVFTATVVITLAFGLGATSAIFALFDAVILRPLPYTDPGKLVVVWESNPERGAIKNEVSLGNFLDWRDRSRSFEHLAALTYRTLNLTSAAEPERLNVGAVSVDFFRMLGVAPALGRTFVPEEERPDAPPSLILSHSL